MAIPIPNWRKVACPHCGARVGETCTFEDNAFYMAHRKRRELADRTFGVYMPVALNSHREKTPAMHYWSIACQSGHPDLCTGIRKARNGERGVKKCENPIHRQVISR